MPVLNLVGRLKRCAKEHVVVDDAVVIGVMQDLGDLETHADVLHVT